ncbi:hypothetical protein SAMN05428957_102188 [Oryzisolibacter propanilivorax]|uniref:Uncharacterized protein n=1 Tax=Oryzisolibacter propanilivorax TaxID=1527607 RepID=A0A1G9QCK1_9BURK|nr:hypothetical protein [Oryzisolibacter propanilivorax]SDM08197.1 hypothetical protein SAMN05428957_102188 [Oryzisolibacter propanilivorax]
MKNSEDLYIYITAVNWVLAILFLLSLLVFAYQMRMAKYPEAVSSLQAVIPIAAAWLILFIADRQILIDIKEKKYRAKLDAIKSLHYLIVIASDLQSQASHLSFMMEKEDYYVRPHYLETLARGIEQRYEEIIQEKESYRHLSGEVINKIIGLSGSIFGMTNLLRSIAYQANKTEKEVRDIFNSMNKSALIKNIKSTDLEINSIVEYFYKARRALDSDIH